MNNKLKLIFFLCHFLAICRAGVVSRHKFRNNDIFSVEIEPSTVEKVESNSLSKNSTFGVNETDVLKNSNAVESSVFTQTDDVTELKLNITNKDDKLNNTHIFASIGSYEPDNDFPGNVEENRNVRNRTLNETSPNENDPNKLSNLEFSNSKESVEKGIDILETVIKNMTSINNTNLNDALKVEWLHRNSSNVTEPIFEETKVNQSLTSAISQSLSNKITDQGMEFSGDISDNESIQELESGFSTNTVKLDNTPKDASKTEGVGSIGGFEFLMNFDVAKNAAMAMEIFNLTDSSLTDHIINENEFHGLLDLMLPTTDNTDLNSTDISTTFHNISEERNKITQLDDINKTERISLAEVVENNQTLRINLTEIVEDEDKQTLRVNLTEVVKDGNETVRVNLTAVVEKSNQTLMVNLTEVVKDGNETVLVNLTAVMEKSNQTLMVNLTEVVKEGNETVRVNLTEVVKEGNETVRVNLTGVVEEGNETVRINLTELVEVANQTAVELNFHEVVNHEIAIFNNSKVENQTKIVISEMEMNNTSNPPPKCPPPGICLFWFFAQDTCAVNDHCLGSRICCRIRCSKTCIEV